MMKITAQKWNEQRQEAARRSAAVDRMMPPYRRERPRDATEAKVLRRLGVPKNLIGSSMDQEPEGIYKPTGAILPPEGPKDDANPCSPPCTCEKGLRCLNCIERDGLTKTAG